MFTRNHNKCWGMYGDVPKIIYDILKCGAKLTIVSRNQSKAVWVLDVVKPHMITHDCSYDQALWWWNATDLKDKKKKSIIQMVKFNEVYDSKFIHAWVLNICLTLYKQKKRLYTWEKSKDWLVTTMQIWRVVCSPYVHILILGADFIWWWGC